MKVNEIGFEDGSSHVICWDPYPVRYLYAITGPGTYDWKPTKDMYLNHFTLRLA